MPCTYVTACTCTNLIPIPSYQPVSKYEEEVLGGFYLFSKDLEHFLLVSVCVPYIFSQPHTQSHVGRKSRKLSRAKTFANWRFRGLLAFTVPKNATPPNIVKKTFTNSHKTAKFAKVFSLESFLLYGTFSSHVAWL